MADPAGGGPGPAANPFYPVAEADYPRLLDFEITPGGRVYLGRLMREWSSGDLPDEGCRRLSALRLAEAAASRSAAECRAWQAMAFLSGGCADALDPGTRAVLAQMGCVADNPRHDPRLLKRHLAWAGAAARRARAAGKAI